MDFVCSAEQHSVVPLFVLYEFHFLFYFGLIYIFKYSIITGLHISSPKSMFLEMYSRNFLFNWARPSFLFPSITYRRYKLEGLMLQFLFKG